MAEQYKAEFVFDVDLHGTKTYTGSAINCMAQFNDDVRDNVIPDFCKLISFTAVNCIAEN